MAFGEFNFTTFFCSVLISASSGPLVLYGKRAWWLPSNFCWDNTLDPNDPLASLYDVDDGESLHWIIDLYTETALETTVITLADWYHNVAPSLFPNPGDVDPWA